MPQCTKSLLRPRHRVEKDFIIAPRLDRADKLFENPIRYFKPKFIPLTHHQLSAVKLTHEPMSPKISKIITMRNARRHEETQHTKLKRVEDDLCFLRYVMTEMSGVKVRLHRRLLYVVTYLHEVIQ